MARRKLTPSYLEHKQSGKGRAVWTDATGMRQQKLLPGPFESGESRAAFGRLLLELATSPVASVTRPATITVNEVLIAYYGHAEKYYSGLDGKPTKELGCMMPRPSPFANSMANCPPSSSARWHSGPSVKR